MKKAYLWLLLPLILSAYDDSDFDGVEDAFDKCPNSSFTDIVDKDGCSVATLTSPHSFDMIFGIAVSQNNQKTLSDTPTSYGSIQLDYFYKDFTASISFGGYSDENTTALNDTVLGAYNRFYLDKSWSLSLGGSIILPTYDTGLKNEAVDYAISAEVLYTKELFSAFISTTYSFINDKDTTDIRYQNTTALFLGSGYTFSDSFYASLSYYYSQSIYSDVVGIENISIYMYYAIDTTYFLTCNYALGLSDSTSANYLSLRFGINF
jgi:hypothetical protein